MCMVQRVIFIAILIVFALATLHGPKRVGERVYAALVVVLSLLVSVSPHATYGYKICPKTRFPPAALDWIT